jgi:hypothetical protein
MGSTGLGRVRVERGIYRQRNRTYAVCWRHAGRLRFRTVGSDVAEARRARLALIAATHEGSVPVSPRLRFETVAGWWLERFEAKVAAGVRHPRTLEAHRYQLDRHLLAPLGRRAIAVITVDDVAPLLQHLRTTGCSAKTAAGALATLHCGDQCCGRSEAQAVRRTPRLPGIKARLLLPLPVTRRSLGNQGRARGAIRPGGVTWTFVGTENGGEVAVDGDGYRARPRVLAVARSRLGHLFPKRGAADSPAPGPLLLSEGCGRLRRRAADSRKGRPAVVTDDDVRALAIAAGSEREPIVGRRAPNSSIPVV